MYKKNLDYLHSKLKYVKYINSLDKNNIYVLYFSYSVSWKNIICSPLLIFTKLYSIISRKPLIDHTAHISRFVYDPELESFNAKIFEGIRSHGMVETDLWNKIRDVKGKVYIEDTGVKVDKSLAKIFENTYRGVAYSKLLAGVSALDFVDKKKIKQKGGFCSWLTTKFLISQGFERLEKPNNVTPAELFQVKLGKKEIIWRK